MRRIYAVIELQEFSTFDATSDEDLDALAEDLLHVTHGVASATVYGSAEAMLEDIAEERRAD